MLSVFQRRSVLQHRQASVRWLGLAVSGCMWLAATAGKTAAADQLWVSTMPLEGNRQLLMVVDQQRQVLAVYHIDTASGAVTLRSTRALGYDLQLEDFNATDPRPAALRKMMLLGGPGQPTTTTPSAEGATIVPNPGANR